MSEWSMESFNMGFAAGSAWILFVCAVNIIYNELKRGKR